MMSNSSNSTLLLNFLIALSTPTPNFPSPLWKQGFQLEKVEPIITLSDGAQAKPDIQFKKHEDYLLFFECKDGSCEEEQLGRYKRMTSTDITRSHATSLSAQHINFDLAYLCTTTKEAKLVASVTHHANPFPILVLGKNNLSRHDASQKFKSDLPNSILDGITFDTPIPMSFIPFTPNDDDLTIKIAILQHFATKFGQTFTLGEICSNRR